jgi:hypothetical protein
MSNKLTLTVCVIVAGSDNSAVGYSLGHNNSKLQDIKDLIQESNALFQERENRELRANCFSTCQEG